MFYCIWKLFPFHWQKRTSFLHELFMHILQSSHTRLRYKKTQSLLAMHEMYISSHSVRVKDISLASVHIHEILKETVAFHKSMKKLMQSPGDCEMRLVIW